tara:strand:+ start:964 stop:1254 length:291 start_codon:yes stop_codon:yes gene_type:complete
LNNQNENHIDKLERNLILLLNRLKDNNNVIDELNQRIIEVEKKNSNLEKLKGVDDLQKSLSEYNNTKDLNFKENLINKIDDIINSVDDCIRKVSNS